MKQQETFFGQNINPGRNIWHSFTVITQTLNIHYDYQVGVFGKTLTLPKDGDIILNMSQTRKIWDSNFLLLVDLTLKDMKMPPWYSVFSFLFCLELTVREQLDESDFVTIMVFFLKEPWWNYLVTAMFKVLSQKLLGTLTTAFPWNGILQLKILRICINIGTNSFLSKFL